MKAFTLLVGLLSSMLVFSQEDSTDFEIELTPVEKKPQRTIIFDAPKMINTNTVQLIPRNILEFKVSHNFGDLAGEFGGIKNFFGLDNAADIRIGFQYGLSRKINLAFARYKGSGPLQKIYELGVKYVFLQQMDGSRKHPISLGVYANESVTTMKEFTDPASESHFKGKFYNRLSSLVQLMIAQKKGRISWQLTPSYLYRSRVLDYDEHSLLAVGGAMHIHLGGRYSLLLDYFHTFRKKATINAFNTNGVKFYNPLGIGFEILTGGHVFQLNFTNATDLLENRFLSRTVSSWGKGQFRWGFSVSRDFDLIWKKRNR